MDAKHFLLTKFFDKEMNSQMKSELEKKLTKRRKNVSSSEIFEFFTTKIPYKKEDAQQKQFLEDLILLILLKITYLCILWKVLG